jgi:nucleoside-diphosphate-sugar epimerase
VARAAHMKGGSLNVAIAGGNGRIGRWLARDLAAHGDRVHTLDTALDGASAADLSNALRGADAVVLVAGNGPGHSHEWTAEADTTLRLMEAARKARVRRYVLTSPRGAEDPPEGDDAWSVYLRAKADADRVVAASGLAWTIVRPGAINDAADLGRVLIDTEPVMGDITREDVAATLAEVLHEPRSARLTLHVAAGEYPVDWALESVVRPSRPHGGRRAAPR